MATRISKWPNLPNLLTAIHEKRKGISMLPSRSVLVPVEVPPTLVAVSTRHYVPHPALRSRRPIGCASQEQPTEERARREEQLPARYEPGRKKTQKAAMQSTQC